MAERSKGLAGLLALLLGAFGAHRFYLNRERSALSYFVPAALVAMLLVYTGTRMEGLAADPWTVAFLALLAPAAFLVLMGWAEAVRLWAMPQERFRRIYVEPVLPTQEAAPQARTPVQTGKKKTTAAVLGLLLGWLGIHRLYLGRPLSGVLLLLLGLLALSGLLLPLVADLAEGGLLAASGGALFALLVLFGLMDGLRILVMPRRAFSYRYGKPAEAPAA